jgi:hypothetical protein
LLLRRTIFFEGGKALGGLASVCHTQEGLGAWKFLHEMTLDELWKAQDPPRRRASAQNAISTDFGHCTVFGGGLGTIFL